MELSSLYSQAATQGEALRATLEAIDKMEQAARGASPTVGYSLPGMYAHEAMKAAEYCREMLTPSISRTNDVRIQDKTCLELGQIMSLRCREKLNPGANLEQAKS